MLRFLFFLFLLPVPMVYASAQHPLVQEEISDSVHFILREVQDSVPVFVVADTAANSGEKTRRPRRLVASLLCITLGPFGVHRLYLGTTPNVPVAYTLTLGGGVGILPVVDLLLIVFSNDITPYLNNPNVFMWSEAEQ